MNQTTRRVTAALILCVAVIIGLYFLVLYSVDIQNRDTLVKLDSTILNQEKLLISLSEATRVNGADEATERIIVDCKASERQRFDQLLDSLSGNIKTSELKELDELFYKCGSFYADRKSVMATRLVREVDILEEYQNLRSVLSNQGLDQTDKITAWRNLAEAELKTAEYFKQLVMLQGTIITQLNSGKSANSPEIVATLNEVSSVRGQMLILSKQIEIHKAEALKI